MTTLHAYLTEINKAVRNEDGAEEAAPAAVVTAAAVAAVAAAVAAVEAAVAVAVAGAAAAVVAAVAAAVAAEVAAVAAAAADDEALRRGPATSTQLQLPACAMFCQTIFRLTAASKGEDAATKRAVALAVVCIMIKVYFRLNTLTNCKNVVKQADSLNIFETTEASHKVTFRYYTGRLAAYDEDFPTADKHLTYAFNQCHPSAEANKRRVLRFLVPIRLLLGQLPSPQLLQQYRLPEFMGICEAMRSGNVGLLLRTLDAHQATLVQAGTYLLLEKLQLAVYRRLFKKCALVHAAANPAKATQMPLALFHTALEAQGVVKEDAELQCLVANLIYRKFIKGYIAYKARVVVLAKTDAFPPLSEVQLGDPFGA
ncbi:hypothetical protein QJQ45_002784 [Haematococcus lacustris]|nr:hypothetical protein QJQ45_002784 [Haematococcus lacustris]